MPRKVVIQRHLADVLVVRQRRGTVYAFLTFTTVAERRVFRFSCPAFDFIQSVRSAERKIEQMYPDSVFTWDRIQVERGVAFGWLD